MAALPPPPPTAPPSSLIPHRPDGSWPALAIDPSTFWPLALAPFGIVLLVYLLVIGFLGWDGDGGGVLITFAQQLALALPVALWVRRRTGSLAALGLEHGRWSRRDVGVGIGMGLLVLVGAAVVLVATIAVVEAIQGHAYEFPGQEFEGSWQLAYALLAIVFAPVCEELYFRGFLFQGLRGWTRFAWAAIASGFAFSFVHVEPIRFASLWLTGIVLAAIFERRRTLVSSICAHAVVNVAAVLLSTLAA